MAESQLKEDSVRQTKIITTDIPDPDNFLMVLRALKSSSNHHIDIVLSPRPVSFATYPYGDNQASLLESVYEAFKGISGYSKFPHALRHILSPISESSDKAWIESLKENDRAWFYVDKGFDDPEVIEDTTLYMKVSWLRMVDYLDAHGVDRDQYSFYWDTTFEHSQTIQPGCHHAAHRADFTFGFSDDAKKSYQEAITKGHRTADGTGNVQSQELRATTRRLCEQYHDEKLREKDLAPQHTYGDLQDLIAKHSRTSSTSLPPDLFVGGPFTEAVAIVRGVPAIRRVVAMGGFIDGSANIFTNQFNLMVDMESARELFRLATEITVNSHDDQGGHARPRIDLTLLPTECVKGSAYELTPDDFERHVGSLSPPTRALYAQWDAHASRVDLFDLVAIMAAEYPTLFRSRRVRAVDDGSVITFKPLSPQEQTEDEEGTGSGITMYWNEAVTVDAPQPDGSVTKMKKFNADPHMLANRELFLRELRRTFEPQLKSEKDSN